MPDLKDAQVADALTEAGALPQWENVTIEGAPHCNLQRICVEGGWLYGTNGCAQVFVPRADEGETVAELRAEVARLEQESRDAAAEYSTMVELGAEIARKLEAMTADRDRAQKGYETTAKERDEARKERDLITARFRESGAGNINQGFRLYEVLGQLAQEKRGRESAEARCEELRTERGEARAEMERRGAQWLEQVERQREQHEQDGAQLSEAWNEVEKLKKQNAELRRQVEGWEAAALTAREERDIALAAARTIKGVTDSIGTEHLTCTGRAPANVGPSAYTMRGCRLAEGHAGPCEA